MRLGDLSLSLSLSPLPSWGLRIGILLEKKQTIERGVRLMIVTAHHVMNNRVKVAQGVGWEEEEED